VAKSHTDIVDPLQDDKVDQLEFTAMRVHELALQRWLNKSFIFKEGFPIPVVFATPRDAHHNFANLWKSENNPYAYLKGLKDKDGKPVFQPYPSNVFYPLISVSRLNWRFRQSQSYGARINRTAYYPTVQGTLPTDITVVGNGTISRNDMAWAAHNHWPVGWDFRFQVDHFCNFPQTQSVFVNRLMERFKHTGGIPQTYMAAKYPFPQRKQFIRAYIESDIDNVNNDAQDEQSQEIRTSFTVVLEGYWYDYKTEIAPVLWYVGLGKDSAVVPPDELDRWFDFNEIYPGLDDVRIGANNPTIESRGGLPPVTE
jgi:hypothetical protein